MWQKRLIRLEDPPLSSKKRLFEKRPLQSALKKKTFTPIYQGIQLPFYNIRVENEDDFQICFSMWKIMFCEKDLSVQNKFLEK